MPHPIMSLDSGTADVPIGPMGRGICRQSLWLALDFFDRSHASRRQPLGFGDWPIFVPWPSAGSRDTAQT